MIQIGIVYYQALIKPYLSCSTWLGNA